MRLLFYCGSATCRLQASMLVRYNAMGLICLSTAFLKVVTALSAEIDAIR